MAGKIEIGRVSEGRLGALPLGIGITIACFQDCGTRPVSKLELITSSIMYPIPLKNFRNIATLMSPFPLEFEGHSGKEIHSGTYVIMY